MEWAAWRDNVNLMNPEAIEKLIADGRDSAEARMAAGQARLKAGDTDAAIAHLERAVEFRSDYAAAWQLLGKARNQAGDPEQAGVAWRKGLEVARAHGDKQIEKVLEVWLKRLDSNAQA